MSDLHTIIKELISTKREWQYWDFKREWYTSDSKANFIHDILCLANAKHDGDRYIIIGISDDGEIVGVENDKNRRHQNDIIDQLRSVPFSQERAPEVELRKLNIGSKEVDVIVIKNSNHKPYYLIESHPKGKDNRRVQEYYIYTRKGCTNTPVRLQPKVYHR